MPTWRPILGLPNAIPQAQNDVISPLICYIPPRPMQAWASSWFLKSQDDVSYFPSYSSIFSPCSNPGLASLNPLPHGVLATFSLTAWGFMDPPKKDDISRENAILMTSLQTYRASAVSSPGLHYTYPPPSHPRHWEVIGYTKSFLLVSE